MRFICKLIEEIQIKYLEKTILKMTPDKLQKKMDRLERKYLNIKKKYDKTVVVYLSTDEIDTLERLECQSEGDNLIRNVYLQAIENKHLKRKLRG